MTLHLPRLILRWINESRGEMSIQSFIIKTLTDTQNFKNYEEKHGKNNQARF